MTAFRSSSDRGNPPGVLKALAGGALSTVAAAVGRADAVAAARKRVMGVVCSKNADCASNACLPKDRTGRRRCGCGSPGDCPPATAQCQLATCNVSVCGTTITVDAPCEDGNHCTTDDVC